MPSDITVMLIDDHEVVRRGVAEVIDRADGLTVVAEAATVAQARQRMELVRPQVLLVDLQLPDGTGIDVIEASRSLPQTLAIVLTSFEDADAHQAAVAAGARAFLLKTVRGSDIVDTVRAVAAGRSLISASAPARDHRDPTAGLTPSQRQVLAHIGEGLSNREIAVELGIAEKTVKNHVTALLSCMGLQRRTQAAAWVASQRGAWRPRPNTDEDPSD